MVIGNKLKLVYYFLVFIFIAFCLAIVLSSSRFNHRQFSAFIVQSQSMEPTFSKGSLIIIDLKTNYQTGDIVTFRLNDNPDQNPITHRIFKTIDQNGQTLFATKGDANTVVDNQLINKSEIIGKVIYQIPYLGMFIYTAQTAVGSIFYIILPTSLILFIEIKNIIKTLKRSKK